MESSIFKYILRYTLKDQLWILLLTVISLPFIYATLEVPKLIINDAIGGANIPDTLLGYEIDQISYLFVLCAIFLLLVIINGGIKYILNVYRGVVGERMLRRLRYELFCRLLRFPIPHFKKISQGEVIPIITAETEPLGGFIGEAFALPAFQGGILFTYLFFIFNQDLLLGVFATVLYPFQIYVIPKLQRKVNLLGKERVLAARKLGDRIGDSISGIREIHAHDTSHFEKAVISQRLGHIFQIRVQIYKKKFFIKFLNNFLAQVTPSFFFAFGGYFVIQGELSLGALVAVLAAYKDLSSPWKELLKYYQTKEDVRIKYEQIIDHFHPKPMLDRALQEAPPMTLEIGNGGGNGEWRVSNLSYAEHEGINLIERLSFQVPIKDHIAVFGIGASGKEELGQLLSRLVLPTAGRISLAGSDLAHLPESAIGHHLAHVGANAHLFSGSILDNLFYPLRHRQQHIDDEVLTSQQLESQRASEMAGNSTDDPFARWIDYRQLGLEDEAGLRERLHRVLEQADIGADVLQLGLLGMEGTHAEGLEERVLKAREQIHAELETEAFQGLVEPFDWQHYNTNLTVLENILFSPTSSASQGLSKANLDLDSLAGDERVQRFLQQQELLDDLLLIGRRITEIMVDLFSDVDESSDLFERFSFIRAEELPEYRTLLTQTADQKVFLAKRMHCQKFLSLTFKLSPVRHRLGLIDRAMQLRILQARFAFAERFADSDINLEFFDRSRFNTGLNLQDNMLFGKLVYGQAKAQEKVSQLILKVVNELSLEQDLIEVGLAFEVGSAGTRLSLPQRQKLAIAQALMKQPDVLILNDATAGMDPSAESRVLANLKEALQGRGLILITSRIETAAGFDYLLMMDRGELVAQGSYQEVKEKVRLDG